MNLGFTLPAFFFSESVTLTYYDNESQDAEGGMTRTELSTTTTNASVQEEKMDRWLSQGREGESITHKVYFKTNPNLNTGDTITYGTRVLSVISTDSAVANADPEWCVRCREMK